MEVLLTFTPHESSVSNGKISESAGNAVDIRGEIKQLSGYKKMLYSELASVNVYEFKCYDNPVLASSAVTSYRDKTLNIREIIKNKDESFTNSVKLILVSK